MSGVEWGPVIGLGVLLVLWFLLVHMQKVDVGESRDWLMSRFWNGYDGRASFSKFQFWLWTLTIFYAFISLWFARMIADDLFVTPLDGIPDEILAILGISSGTTVLAKGITSMYAQSGVNAKASYKRNQDTARADADNAGERQETALGQLLTDDSGVPELAKLQMFLFTIAGVAFYIITTIGAILEADTVPELALPNVDQAFLVLMGLSSGGYIGKKLVTRDKPSIADVTPNTLPADGTVMITGSGLGVRDAGVFRVDARLFKHTEEKTNEAGFEEWAPQLITLNLKSFAPRLQPGEHELQVTVYDMPSNIKKFTIESAQPGATVPEADKPTT